MIADLKPYPEYKESGLPWLGQVPGHWEVRRTKSAVMNVIEQTFEMASLNPLPWSTWESSEGFVDVDETDTRTSEPAIPAERSAKQ